MGGANAKRRDQRRYECVCARDATGHAGDDINVLSEARLTIVEGCEPAGSGVRRTRGRPRFPHALGRRQQVVQSASIMSSRARVR